MRKVIDLSLFIHMKRFGKLKFHLKKKHKKRKQPSVRSEQSNDNEDILAVIEDVDNGHEFYVSFIDHFVYNKREYVAMSVYDSFYRSKGGMELVLMRTDTDHNGDHYYQSIRNKRELDGVFDEFFNRYIHMQGLA